MKISASSNFPLYLEIDYEAYWFVLSGADKPCIHAYSFLTISLTCTDIWKQTCLSKFCVIHIFLYLLDLEILNRPIERWRKCNHKQLLMAIMTAMVMYILKQVSTVHRDNEHARSCILCQHRRPFCGCHCGLVRRALDLSIAGGVALRKGCWFESRPMLA